jgi:hydrogenase nickel incorporation protein HypB
VTEGEDKPLKYPQMFHSSELAVITKTDLAEPCEFDRAAAIASIEAVHPGLPVIETSKRDATSIDRLVDHLIEARTHAVEPATVV